MHKLRNPNEPWSIEDAALLYGIRNWGRNIVDIAENGNLGLKIDDGLIGFVDLIDRVEKQGFETPCLLRFPHLIEERIEELHEGFLTSMKDEGYEGGHQAVFPIKVNQDRAILETVSKAGRPYHLGLEAGSKAELLACLAYCDDPEAFVICNGLKDQTFIELALAAESLGLRSVLVLEKPSELTAILETSDRLGIRPRLGVRLRVGTPGGGHWTSSSGPESRFGLSISQIFEVLKTLRNREALDCLEMLHFHQGSQLPQIDLIREAVKEAVHVYVHLCSEGARMGLLNLGGGLAVDYAGHEEPEDPANTRDYDPMAYCRAISRTLVQSFQEANPEIAHPRIITESGRAMVSDSSVLVFQSLDPGPKPTAEEVKLNRSNPELDPLVAIISGLDINSSQRTSSAARKELERLYQRFKSGQLDIRTYAEAERMMESLWHRISSLYEATHLPSDGADQNSADYLFGNFSLFQSAPDAWALNQIFPIVPIERLGERPTQHALVVDMTCDCDGKISKYPTQGPPRRTLPVHTRQKDTPYRLALFHLGAYQETLANLHNLLGAPHVVTIDRNGSIDGIRPGDSVGNLLELKHFDPEVIRKRLTNKQADALPSSDNTPINALIERAIAAYSYYQEKPAPTDSPHPTAPREDEERLSRHRPLPPPIPLERP